MQPLPHIENFYHPHFLDLLYEPLHLKFILWNLWCIIWTKSKIKSLPLIYVSKIFDILNEENKKDHQQLEFILHYSIATFEETKLITIIHWIFHAPELWREDQLLYASSKN